MDELRIRVGRSHEVGALLERPPGATCLLVLAHGAGAGMRHAFLEALAGALSRRGVATLRHQFPFTEAGAGRPDPPGVLQATVRSAVETARTIAEGLPTFAGGKSLGGRMTSMAQAQRPLPGVAGLVFVGFPLHAPGKPGIERGRHLADVSVPMLFLQGTRDRLAGLDLLAPLLAPLSHARLHVVEGADHGFHVLRRSGRTDEDVLEELAAEIARWTSDGTQPPSAVPSSPG
jgi:predicted alpha/beta-hydrolase family hydrolase